MDASRPLIVGIGASAGGIPAMEGLFRHGPSNGTTAFVVITHLSPQRESLLHQVIARLTSMPVHVVQDGVKVEAGNVYVMPENATLSISDGCLLLHPIDPLYRERKPIDMFFSALAEDQAENAVGIVLSGGDSDGTLGIKAIKEHGGVTLAQKHDGSGPRNPEMPESAISSGLVDFALPVEEMGEKLDQIAGARAILDDVVQGQESEADRFRRAQDQISQLLRSHAGHDFSGYKSKTFLRRVARRMQFVQQQTIEAYIARLREDPAEVLALFRDLLINVTEFFRDADAFRTLEEKALPRLFDGRGADEAIRIWAPGCATGEEVFSLAILMRERADTFQSPPRIQIFATDIDEPALAVARAGRYPEQLLRKMSPERRQRHFINDGGGWVVRKQVRDLCIFSPHSLISDPPFSRMDLVSCRNLLIYLGRDLQDQVIPIFHYALKPGGYLFLGSSESIGQHSDLFTAIDKKHRLFQSHGQGPERRRLPVSIDGTLRGARRFDASAHGASASAYQLRQRVETQVLERHAPAHVVVRDEGEIVYYSTGTGRYLEAPRGAPNRQLLELVRRELRLELRAALRQAVETRRPTQRLNVLQDDDGARFVSIRVEPLDGLGQGETLFLVLFAPLGPAPAPEAPGDVNTADAAMRERDLRDMHERLQSTVEEYETALEELKSSNEELVSVNEEAQSANEELEASKEEMQSLNEELTTINAELNAKVEELDGANTDLKNLYEATRIATVFLDSALVIRNFTPAASAFFNLRSSDIGRPLTELASVLDYPELQDHIARVFATGAPVEHRLSSNGDDCHYLVQLIPFRNRAEKVGGVVVTLVDITSLGRAEEHQKVLIAELNHRVKNMLAVVISIVNTTLRHAVSPESFTQTLLGRLQSMARAYGLLSQETWLNISIRRLLAEEASVYGSGRFALQGPDVPLKPPQVLALGLVIHELATNAAKYGALADDKGRVELVWSAEEGWLTLLWRERDGPIVKAPERIGFGSVLMKGQVQHQLRGEFDATFNPEGLSVRISFPLE
jgi:two-component system CheB/CheR fusion protein